MDRGWGMNRFGIGEGQEVCGFGLLHGNAQNVPILLQNRGNKFL
jgi:hypothetical protein